MESSGNGAVIEPLLTIEREDLTGTLEFRARGVRTAICAVGGELIDAEGGSLGETLGRLLLRSERVSEDAFGAVIRRMTDVLLESQVIRFGEVAVNYGFLTADDLDLALTQQVREKIMGCIHRGDGEWRFVSSAPGADRAGGAQRLVRTRPALVEAARQLSERRVDEILVLREHRFPEIVAPPNVLAAEFELSADEAAVLTDLDGTSSLHFILPKATHPDVPALLAALVLGGGVELRTAPAGSRQGDRPIPPTFMTLRRDVQRTIPDPIDALPRLDDIETTASLKGPLGELRTSQATVAARRAFERRPSRDHLSPTPPEAQERSRVAFERLRSDLETHKPASERRRWPEPTNDRERRLMAESAFHRGRLYLRAEEAGMALPGLSRAHELRPSEQEYELYVKWAQMLVNDTFRDDARRSEMQALAALVVRADPWCELAFAVLGQCAFHDGKEEAALRFFQRAAQLDPKRLDASRLTELLAGKRADAGRVVSKPDLRSRARGELDTRLDEIVPQTIPTAGRSPAPAPKRTAAGASRGTATLRPPAPEVLAETLMGASRETPYGGLEAAPKPPVADVSPSSPTLSSAVSEPPAGVADHDENLAPMTPPPPSPSPWVPLTLPQLHTQPLIPQPLSRPPPPSSGVPASVPVPVPARGAAPDLDLPPLRPRRSRAAIVVALGLGIATLAGGVLYLTGSGEGPAPTVDAASSARAAASPERPPSMSPSEPAVVSTAPAVPAPGKNVDAQAATTGVLRAARRAYGRRIYVDGHIVGEGGHDLTVPCGSHRVRVGSTGTEKTITIPCGTVLELD